MAVVFRGWLVGGVWYPPDKPPKIITEKAVQAIVSLLKKPKKP
jgi:hypothetical protein